MKNPPKQASLEEMVDDYTLLISLPPNSNGQHIHPEYGTSKEMLMLMQKRYGESIVRKALDEKFQSKIENNYHGVAK